MTIGPVSGNGAFVHAGTPGNSGKGEPAEPLGTHGDKGNHGDKGKTHGNNGNGNGNGNDGVQQGNGPRTGGNNPAAQEGNRGNGEIRGNQGNQGNQGDQGGVRGSGSMGTGGPGLPGMLDVAPGIARQLGNTLFSMANGVQSVLRDSDGRPEHRHVPGPPAHSNANSTAGNPSQAASAQAHANAGASAHARADGIPMPSGMNAANAAGRAQGAFAAQGGAATGFANAAANTAATSTNTAGMTAGTTLSQASTLAAQQRAASDAALLAPNRPADAALAAGRTATTAPATAPPPPTATPPTLPAAPALPSGSTAALAAAGLTMATAPVNQPADARGVILPANDAVAAMRAENMLNAAGHTLDGAQRRSLRSRLGSMPKGGVARLLWAMGALGHTNAGEAGSEREIARAMQWLFWMLAIIAYGCLAAAIVIFMGPGHMADDLVGQSHTRWLSAFGLATGAAAWWVARRLSRHRR